MLDSSSTFHDITLLWSSLAPRSSMSVKENHDRGDQRRLPAPVGTLVLPLPEPVKSLNSSNNSTGPHDAHASDHIDEKGIPDVEPPFSVFTTRQKWLIITAAGFAGLFRFVLQIARLSFYLLWDRSPLTANIYFPAIQTIANAFHTSVELINVTITVYMVLQGICKRSILGLAPNYQWYILPTAPLLWGTLSDRLGRRPLFLVCLGLLTISCVGMALVPTDAYWLLVLLRCFQAAGSASTIALGEFMGCQIESLQISGTWDWLYDFRTESGWPFK